MLEAYQINPKNEVHESLLKSENNFENQTNAPNPFPYFDKDTSQEFRSPKKLGKLEIISNPVNRDARKFETAQINLSDSFNTWPSLLPPIHNLNLSSNQSISNPFKVADPTIQLHADGLFAQNSALEETFKLNLPK